MNDRSSKESSEILAPPEIRDAALNLLRSQGYRALSDVEKMLRLEGPSAVKDRRMAQKLGISKDQLIYLMFRDEYRKLAKKRREAAKKARTIDHITHKSVALGFTVSYPPDWVICDHRITAETEIVPILPYQVSAEEAYNEMLHSIRSSVISEGCFQALYEKDKVEAYREFFKGCPGTPSDEQIRKEYANRNLSAEESYRVLMDDPETFIVSFDYFKQGFEMDQQLDRIYAANRYELSQMENGYFQASSADDTDHACVEIIKLEMVRHMSPLELYELDKPCDGSHLDGRRPAKCTLVDGLPAVKYFYTLDTGATRDFREMTKFLNAYLTEDNEGWIIACSCKKEAFEDYKPIFEYVIRSFKRV